MKKRQLRDISRCMAFGAVGACCGIAYTSDVAAAAWYWAVAGAVLAFGSAALSALSDRRPRR